MTVVLHTLEKQARQPSNKTKSRNQQNQRGTKTKTNERTKKKREQETNKRKNGHKTQKKSERGEGKKRQAPRGVYGHTAATYIFCASERHFTKKTRKKTKIWETCLTKERKKNTRIQQLRARSGLVSSRHLISHLRVRKSKGIRNSGT